MIFNAHIFSVFDREKANFQSLKKIAQNCDDELDFDPKFLSENAKKGIITYIFMINLPYQHNNSDKIKMQH